MTRKEELIEQNFVFDATVIIPDPYFSSGDSINEDNAHGQDRRGDSSEDYSLVLKNDELVDYKVLSNEENELWLVPMEYRCRYSRLCRLNNSDLEWMDDQLLRVRVHLLSQLKSAISEKMAYRNGVCMPMLLKNLGNAPTKNCGYRNHSNQNNTASCFCHWKSERPLPDFFTTASDYSSSHNYKRKKFVLETPVYLESTIKLDQSIKNSPLQLEKFNMMTTLNSVDRRSSHELFPQENTKQSFIANNRNSISGSNVLQVNNYTERIERITRDQEKDLNQTTTCFGNQPENVIGQLVTETVRYVTNRDSTRVKKQHSWSSNLHENIMVSSYQSADSKSNKLDAGAETEQIKNEQQGTERLPIPTHNKQILTRGDTFVKESQYSDIVVPQLQIPKNPRPLSTRNEVTTLKGKASCNKEELKDENDAVNRFSSSRRNRSMIPGPKW